MLTAFLGPLVSGIFGVIDKAVEDKDQAARIKAKLQEMVLTGQMKEIEAAAQVIVAEAKSDSWIARSWRPILMLLFGLIIANNYLVVPLFGTPVADIPPDMWDLLKLGVGGYVLGRSVEKGVKVWKERE
jgi:holin (3TMs family)